MTMTDEEWGELYSAVRVNCEADNRQHQWLYITQNLRWCLTCAVAQFKGLRWPRCADGQRQTDM